MNRLRKSGSFLFGLTESWLRVFTVFISVYEGPSISDEKTSFLKQIGVECVDLYISPRGYQEYDFDKSKDRILNVIRDVRRRGLEVNAVFAPPVVQALFGGPEGEKQIEDVCRFIRLVAEKSVRLVEIGLQDVRHGPGGVPGRYEKEHRGRYRMAAFSLELMRKELEKREMNRPWSHNFSEKLAFDEYFSNCVKVMKSIVPVAEESNVRIMSHMEDPPLHDPRLLPSIINHMQILSLFDAVSSDNFGLCFCCGTRYESGMDIFKQIRIFGKRKKIFLVHFRNVRGTIPTTGDYEEVAIDDGDMDMLQVLNALKAVGYDGAINLDHLPVFIGDADRKAALAYTVGYIKGLMEF